MTGDVHCPFRLPALDRFQAMGRKTIGSGGPVILNFAQTLRGYQAEISASATAQAVPEGAPRFKLNSASRWDLTGGQARTQKEHHQHIVLLSDASRALAHALRAKRMVITVGTIALVC